MANDNDAIMLLERFEFWNINHASNGDVTLVVGVDRAYTKVYKRKKETIAELVKRAIEKTKGE